jgi:hypothetical protein
VVEDESVVFIRQRRARTAALVLCDQDGRLPAKLISASSSEVVFTVDFGSIPSTCSAVPITCQVSTPEQLSCRWVGRASYLLARKPRT